MNNNKNHPSKKRVILGPEVWQRVLNWRIFQQTVSLLRQIFKRSFLFGDFEAMGITDEEYERVRGPLKEPRIPFPFCEFIAGTEEGKRRCALESKQSSDRASSTDKTDIWQCHAGLTDLTVPFIFHGKYCGCMTIYGGLLLDEPNETHWQEIAERVKDTGVNLERLKKAYFEITPISKELLGVMLNLMNVMVEEIIKAAVEIEEDKNRVTILENALSEKYHFEKIIGKTPAIRNIFYLLSKVIETDSPVLIEGETGTGKELIANTIHYNSYRKNGPFNPVNCGSFTDSLLESELFGYVKGAFTGAIRDKKGLFEVTDQGTIFLDEIAEMSPALQVKLLRVLQEGTFIPVGGTETRKVDVRIISATNKNLKELVEQGKFREDIYYRLNVLKILLPPLRERKEDIPFLIEYFIQTKKNAKKKKILGIKSNALKAILDYSWPGNIRELQNVLERAIALASSKYITIENLPEEIIQREKAFLPEIAFQKSYKEAKSIGMDLFHKEYLSKLLIKTGGNVTKSAQLARRDRATIQRLLKKYHIKSSDFKSS